MTRSPDSSPPVSVFLADPSRGVRDQVRAWVRAGIEPFRLHTFSTARELLRRMEYQQPDLLLLDVTLPRFDALTALRTLGAAETPLVILSPDTLAGARLAIGALLAGGADYFVKRGRGGDERLALSRRRFAERLTQLTLSEAQGIIPWRGWEEVVRVAGGGTLTLEQSPPPTGWAELQLVDGCLEAYEPTGEPFAAGGGWIGLATATPRSLPRLLEVLVDAPARPGGVMVMSVPQPRRFTQALREALTRRWDQTVLDLREGEAMRPGQWRLLPGRAFLKPRHGTLCDLSFDLLPNRLTDEGRSTAAQLRLLEGQRPGSVRIFLAEPPAEPVYGSLAMLLQQGQTVFLHTRAQHPIAAREQPEPAEQASDHAPIWERVAGGTE